MLLDPRSQNACVVERPEIASSILTSQLSGSYEATVRMGFHSSSPRKRPTARNTQQTDRERKAERKRKALSRLTTPAAAAAAVQTDPLCSPIAVLRIADRRQILKASIFFLPNYFFPGWFYAFALLQVSVVWWNVCNLEENSSNCSRFDSVW
jgi:hypothetical protein